MPKREPFSLRQMRWLHEQYRRFNSKYWDNRLPHDIRIIIVPTGKVGYSIDCRFKPNSVEEGATSTVVDDETGEHLILPTIELNELIMNYPPFARLVLLHEMLHVGGIQGHGKAFKTECQRIAKLGALTDILI